MSKNEQTLNQLRQAVLQKKLKERMQKSLATEKAPISARDPQQEVPLSWAQQRLWFLAQLDPAALTAYHIPAALHLKGQLNITALQAALDKIVARHEILRTTIAMTESSTGEEGKARQIIHDKEFGFSLTIRDLSPLTDDERQAAIQSAIKSEASDPFDFENGPLIRGQLFRLAEDENILLLTQHHIVSDGWSVNVMMQEFSTLYLSFCHGQPDPLPPLKIQYADYTLWQRQELQGKELENQLDYWRNTLQDAPTLLTLPTDRPRPSKQTYAGGEATVTLSPDLTGKLKAFAQRHGITLFMTLLTGWSVLLSRLSGQHDLVIGTPVANRKYRDLEPLIGFFVNTLALRVQLQGNPTVSELLAQVKTDTVAAFENQDLPFEQLVEALKPPRSLSYSPIFQVMMSLDNTPGQQQFELPGLTISELDLSDNSSHFDLSLSLHDTDDGLIGELEYASDLFDHATMERMAGYLQTLLTEMVADDTQRVADLPLLTPNQRDQLLADFNARTADYPQEILLQQLFEQQVAHSPTSPALISGEQQLSYHDLNQQANQLAHALITAGVQPDDRVAICVERGTDMIIGLFGILKAGAGYVPLDPEYPTERLAYILSDCKPKLLLTQKHLQSRLTTEVPVWVMDDDRYLADVVKQLSYNPEPSQLGLKPHHLAYIIYTSGSTGQPKGVMIEHRNVVSFVHVQRETNELTASDRVLQFTSVAFDTTVSDIFATLAAGATLVLRPPHLRIPDKNFSQFLQEQAITVSDLPTAFWHLWVQEMAAGRCGFSPSLRLVIVGGEKAELRHFNTWQTLPETQSCRWINSYGPTETTVIATVWKPDNDAASPAGTVPIGYPLTNTRIYILDTQGQPVPIGVAGEIYIAGSGVARGYLDRPDLTDERFVTDPFSQHADARMYKTGDLGRWLPDGTIEYLERNDFQVKIRGFRIELGEIEAKLAQCDGVKDVVVTAHEDESGNKRLVAYLIPQPETTLEILRLREQLSTQLMEYMLPGAYVILEAFPLTPNGKVDRKALPAPDHTAIISREYQAPEGEAEQQLAIVWQELLGLEQIGRQDNFFELGGHSLLVVSLIEKLRRHNLGIDVSAVFSSPTLAAMAACLTRQTGTDTDSPAVPPNLIPDNCQTITPDMLPLVTLSQDNIDQIALQVTGGVSNIQDIYPLGPLQQGILFQHLLETEGDIYLDSVIMTFDSRKRLNTFLTAMQKVIDRHDILRSAVQWHNLPEPVQVVYRHAPLPVTELIFSAEESSTEQQLRRHTDSHSTRMDITKAPLLSASIVQESQDDSPQNARWLLALQHHHLVCDHLSLEIIFSEIEALLLGQSEDLPAPQPYRNFIAQTRNVPLENHQAYFQQLLGDVEEPTLPFGLLDIQGNRHQIAESVFMLDNELAKTIRDCARQQGVSAAVLFHVAWAQVLAKCSGRDDVIFGTVLLGRLQGGEEASRVLGMFINTLPVRIMLQERTAQQVVQETYRQLSKLLAHEQAPLAVIQRCSGIPASLPLFNSLLNFRHNSPDNEQEFSPIWEGIETLDTGELSNYPLSLDVDDFDDGFSLTAQTSQQIDPARINAYMDVALRGLVSALQKIPEQNIQSIPVLPSTEYSLLLKEFNGTKIAYPQDILLQQLFEQQAALSPDAIALISSEEPSGKKQFTYAELNQRANQLAHTLIAAGVQPDDRVAFCVERSADMVIAMLAILKSGAGYVPLDCEYPQTRLAYILSDSQPKLLLTQQHLQTNLSADMPVWALDSHHHLDAMAGQPTHNPDPHQLGLEPHHLAYIIYTSGSTGQPKGVMIEHRNVVNFVHVQRETNQLIPSDRVLQFTSVAFDTTVSDIFATLASGATLVLRTPDIRIPDASFTRFLQEQRITVSDLPTAFWHLWVQEMAAGRCGFSPYLRLVIVGGEKAELRHFMTWQSMPETHSCQWINSYGPTETTVIATVLKLDSHIPYQAETMPIGYPLTNNRLYILDSHGQPVPLGVSGEIHIGGAGVARGYLNRPDLTDERFIPDTFSEQPNARMYKTGDLGRWLADGTIEYLERNDFQVKIRGYRIELGEIETQLAACAGVKDAIVIAREDENGDKRLVAYLVAQPDITLDIVHLREDLDSRLMEYMVPSAFVVLDAFPLTPNGKLDRQALPEPDHTAIVSREYQAPQGENEQLLAVIWQNLLGLGQVGRHDNFFELGGHSLLVVSLIEQLRQRGFTLAVSAVFSAPTLIAMADRLAETATDNSITYHVPPNLIPDDCRAITPDMLPLVTLTQDNIDQIVADIPDGIANIQDIYPLGPLQEGILFHHLLETTGDTYLGNLLMTFDSRERLDTFLQTVQLVIERHDILRSAVYWENLPEPVQVVHRHALMPVTELELSPEIDAEQQLRDSTDPDKIRMDVTKAPLLAASIAKDPHSDKWLLSLLHHHLVCDHLSLELVFDEVNTLLQGLPEQLPQPLPYRNFIAQTKNIPPEQYQAYFQQLLGDVEEPTLPFGLSDVQNNNGGITEDVLTLDNDLVLMIQQCARQQGVSAAVLFHVAWAQVLAQCSGRDDVVFGTVLLGRLQGGEKAERILGMFINTLPVRVVLQGRNIQQAVQETYQQLSQLLIHEQAPLAVAQRCSSIPASLPLFNSLLNFRHSSLDNEDDLSPVWKGIETLDTEELSNYPLSLDVDAYDDGFELTAQCSQQIDPARINAYMITALRELVAALQSTPDLAVQAISVLPPEENSQLLVEFNGAEIAYPQDILLHQLFEQQAILSPDATALISCEGLSFERISGEKRDSEKQPTQKQLSYAELNQRANQLAHALIAAGVQPDDRVAICVERSLDMIIGLFGILKAGAGYVPLDTDYPTDRLAYILSDCKPKLLLTQKHLQNRLATEVPVWLMDSEEHQLTVAQQPTHNPEHHHSVLTPHHLAYIIYTSGSTGQPKGVMIEHRNVVNFVHVQRQTNELTPADRVLQFTSVAFDTTVSDIFATLATGATLILRPTDLRVPDNNFGHFLREQQITVTDLPTAFWHQWVQELAAGRCGFSPSLRLVIVGGEKAELHHLTLWKSLAETQTCRWINSYGPTEATVIATVLKVDGHSPYTAATLPIGFPLTNTRIYILDRQGRPAPLGVCGEIHIGGAGVARGYLNQPELTAERFIPDPFSHQLDARMYKTGDLGRWLPDGTIEYLGRNDFQVKIRGFRIELGEIEARLFAYPGIKDAIVLVREDTPNDKRLVAYLVPQPDTTLDLENLRHSLHVHLASYMVPAAFVILEAFPLTPNGKLDRRALPAPDKSSVISRSYEAPIGETEEIIAEIWQDVLRLEQVGRHDHFLELGGHSLLTLQVITRLNQVLDKDIGIRDLLVHPTISELATFIRSDTSLPEQKNVVTIRQGNGNTSLFLIHAINGDVNYVYDLEPYIDDDELSIYGVLASETYAEEDIQLTLNDIAQEYIKYIRQIQPHGPYYLAGWSSGGTIAYEISRQLIGVGETVNFIGLLDTTSNYLVDFSAEEQHAGMVSEKSLTLLELVPEGTPDDIRNEFEKLADNRDYDEMLALAEKNNLLPPQVTRENVSDFVQLRHNLSVAAYYYIPSAIDADVTLFRATEEISERGKDLGWSKILPPERLTIIPIKGDHTSIMEQPNIRNMGKVLATVIKDNK
ncbi:non-ribosomal peptide synthetase [Xenorhabdus innexi]|uniref:Amino acid adenylation n=1 Tax=Xenorhabdus innexi TaxID=290109 RepID=A0A1N6MVQ6_9GAMM|nr:non-ribosomal peptide synthetase [Xenorhabdus innexi]PHM33529.1 Amino acid adenylation [Xenorhabdus innexi]SIP72948.1 Peptide synthetase XpsB [Xenorhabdus innexi]